MTVDQARQAWDSMLNDAHGTPATGRRRHAVRGHAVVAFRTTVLLIVAALAILVLLPAALAAQGARLG